MYGSATGYKYIGVAQTLMYEYYIGDFYYKTCHFSINKMLSDNLLFINVPKASTNAIIQ